MSEHRDSELLALRDELKRLIVEDLSLEDINPEELSGDAALFGAGLGLDSLDAVELVVLLQRHYGIQVKDLEEGRKIFATLDTLAEYVLAHRANSSGDS